MVNDMKVSLDDIDRWLREDRIPPADISILSKQILQAIVELQPISKRGMQKLAQFKDIPTTTFHDNVRVLEQIGYVRKEYDHSKKYPGKPPLLYETTFDVKV